MFTIQRTVVANDIDELSHVNNVVYLEWVQEIARQHWAVLTQESEELPYVWMVRRHEIDYRQQAKLGDQLTLRTWVGETKGATSVRHVQIFRGETLLVSAQTTWCLLDASTHRIARITETVHQLLKAQK